MRIQLCQVLREAELQGFVQEMRSGDQPYRLVWDNDPLKSIVLVPDRDGMVALDFLLADLGIVDSDLADALLQRLLPF